MINSANINILYFFYKANLFEDKKKSTSKFSLLFSMNSTSNIPSSWFTKGICLKSRKALLKESIDKGSDNEH